MQGGQAYALRDDLNITSGDRLFLASVRAARLHRERRRPAMRAVQGAAREPELGITFNYLKEAGAILQPPMPLPLLEKPLAPSLAGQPPQSLNTEITEYTVAPPPRPPWRVHSSTIACPRPSGIMPDVTSRMPSKSDRL